MCFDPLTAGVFVAGADGHEAYLGLVSNVERAGRWWDVEAYDYRGGRAEATGVATNADGSVVAISGWVSGASTGFDVLTATYTREDDETITRGWVTAVDGGSSGEDRGEDVAVDSLGHVIVVGRVTGERGAADLAGLTGLGAEPDSEPDVDLPDAPDTDVDDATSICDEEGVIGCPCADDDECDSGLCVSVGYDGGRVCSEFYDGECSESGYTCQPFSIEGRDGFVCFPLNVQCIGCADAPGCRADVNACVELADGDYCVTSCARHGFCPRGSTCTVIDEFDESKEVCLPDENVCSDCFDPDGDRYGEGSSCLGADCDEGDPTRYDGAFELCDGIDNDCDLTADETIDFLSNPDHCGGCGVSCATETGTAECVDGACVVTECAERLADCNDAAADGCEIDLSDSTLCGACGPLPGIPGESCGTCELGTWTCEGVGTLSCSGDLEDEALNVCGGCGELPGVVDEECGTCGSGLWTCDGTEMICGADGGDDALNACGGCAELEGAPEDLCGTCESGGLICSEDGEILTCEGDGGDESLNACGGCAELEFESGALCGACDLGAYECSEAGDSVSCGGLPVALPASCIVVHSVRTGFPIGNASGGGYTATGNARSSTTSTASGGDFRVTPIPTP